MFKTLKNAWAIPELRKKLIFTIVIIILYRFGAVVPVPFVSSEMLEAIFAANSGSIFSYLNILSGNAFSQATLFALSISPYITASIVMQLLTIAIPALEKMQKEGEEGRKKITQITRYVTVGLGLITAYGYYAWMRSANVLTDNSFFAGVVIVSCYVAGASLIMWLGEKINEYGIGNGISMILFANIISGMPTFIQNMINDVTNGISGIIFAIVTVIVGVGLLAFIVFMSESERRLQIQYAKKVVGRKMYGGQNSVLPIKLNMSGVMPIIFANSILAIPSTIKMFTNPTEGSFWARFLGFFESTSWFYVILFFIMIIAFAYFYISISFNPVEVANNLKKNGGFIPGIRPGKPTSDYITKILNKIILIGALCLSVVAILPLIINIIATAFNATGIGSLAFGGTSIIIVVGVALETVRELETQMTMRNYKGFL
ncbi:MAG: preprotein translocase subunit SecY [Ruminococcaceae bacterium]|nr:preprotein translocase subunit SecY [Oscillospiraceae bacterium]